MKEKGRILAWVGLVVILIIAGFLLSLRKGTETVTVLDSGETLVSAEEGFVVSGFPEDLILERLPRIENSYALEYPGGDIRQAVVGLRSRNSLEDNVLAYEEFFSANGWNITHEADLHDVPTFFYAKKGNGEVNVGFSRDAEGKVRVNIAYVER